MYKWIFDAAWSLMQNELTINNFTFSYAQVFLFDLICILLVRAVLIFFDLRG